VLLIATRGEVLVELVETYAPRAGVAGCQAVPKK
jgi:hypothetical protein